jgi:hypothetical protein
VTTDWDSFKATVLCLLCLIKYDVSGGITWAILGLVLAIVGAVFFVLEHLEEHRSDRDARR